MIQLHISETNTSLMCVNEVLKSYVLNLGSDLIAKQFFSDFPPSFDEIDGAINFTEEEVSKYQHCFDGESVLCTNDLMSKQIAKLAFNTKKQDNCICVSRVEIENVFTRLADIVKGRPSSLDILPDNNEFAAYLLILREIIHHLNFEQLWVK